MKAAGRKFFFFPQLNPELWLEVLCASGPTKKIGSTNSQTFLKSGGFELSP